MQIACLQSHRLVIGIVDGGVGVSILAFATVIAALVLIAINAC